VTFKNRDGKTFKYDTEEEAKMDIDTHLA